MKRQPDELKKLKIYKALDLHRTIVSYVLD